MILSVQMTIIIIGGRLDLMRIQPIYDRDDHQGTSFAKHFDNIWQMVFKDLSAAGIQVM